MRHLLNLLDLDRDELSRLLDEATAWKREPRRRAPLERKVIGLVFEKPSLRTRASFEAGIAHMGGTSLFFPGNEVGLGWREPLADFTRTMNHYVDALIMRVFKQSTLEEISRHASFPVINGLSDLFHPCQALADVMTIREEFGSVEGRRIVFIGDGNNVARSLAIACGILGATFVLSSPSGYGFDENFETIYTRQVKGPMPTNIDDPAKAVQNADVIYTDVWASMGQEAEKEERLERFRPYQVNAKLLAKAPSTVKVLHCLPAHRGEEITDEVVESPHSVVFEQAGNRLHAQKAVMDWVFG